MWLNVFIFSNDEAKVRPAMGYLMSASLLVTATPTVDSAEDVTWPAWERLSLVLTHLKGKVSRRQNLDVTNASQQEKKETPYNKQFGTVSNRPLYATGFCPTEFQHYRVALLLSTNTSATCAKSGCKAINRAPILFDLENPISCS